MNSIYERINLKFVFKIKLHINEEVCDVNRFAGWYSPPQITNALSVNDMELDIVPLLDYKKAHNKYFHSFSLFTLPFYTYWMCVFHFLSVILICLFIIPRGDLFKKQLNFETFLIFPGPNLIKKLRWLGEYWNFDGFRIWNMRGMLYWAS